MMTPARRISFPLLAVAIFFAGYLANRQRDPATSSASAERTARYLCPMHPQYTSEHSGECPVCGMSLVPASHSLSPASRRSLPPGTVQVTAEKRQLAGIGTDEVRISNTSHRMRVPGRITADESRLYRIIAPVDGWIRSIGPNFTGTAVKRDQVLGSYYTASMVVSQQNYIYALGRGDQKSDIVSLQRTSLPLNLETAIDTLRGLGMDDLQLQELQRTRKYASEILIHSPVSGFVISRNISPGQRFEKGTELYAISDISHVWVMTDIFEKDREFLSPGATASVHYRGREFRARMSNALPQFDQQSRTLKTRFEVDNPDLVLLPDMFVDVEFHVEKPAALTVPADAVIDSGLRKTVYVEREGGLLEPQIVETGWRLGNRTQITQGLNPGERIVVSGNFLIDSESRMKLSDNVPVPAAERRKIKDLVCGMEIDPDSPNTIKLERAGKTYYFCAETCKNKFIANPAKYINSPPADAAKAFKDPVCGMDVDPRSPGALKTEYKGRTYYFCAAACKTSFETNPGKYIHKAMAAEDMPGSHVSQ